MAAAAILPSPPSTPCGNNSNKRVSFGNEAVKTFVYEKESEEPTPVIPRQPFTDPDAPVAKVTVRADTVRPESPSPILPPAQIEEVRHISVALSPPLPSKKMADTENPFRPEDHLYHEVDPIVEQYLHKPFPPSRPGSTQHTPTKHSSDSPAYLQNGLSKEQLMYNEKQQQTQNRGKRDSSAHAAERGTGADEPLLVAEREHELPQQTKRGSRSSSEKRSGRGSDQHYAGDDLPPAGKVELIHVKRRKCGCCSVQ